MRRVVLALAALTAASCFRAVVEVECVKNADCDAGLCIDGVCTAGADGGVTGGGHHATGGGAGSSGGGVGSPGGGSSGAGPGGGTGATGGGNGCATGCNSVAGCQPGDNALACGSGGAQCTTCNFGDQCVNGACISASCGPQSCNGCCIQGGICAPPIAQTAFNCGANGTMCVQCPQGSSCTNGSCQTSTCAGCLAPSGTCVPPSAQSPQACGSNGASCTPCAPGANCINGVCQTQQPACANCNGCCDSSGTCRGGNNPFACGASGNVCQQCGVGSTCMNHTCTPLVGGNDAGTTVHPAGSACTSSQQCQPPQGGQCIPETLPGGQSTGYPGGYCTRQCGAMGCGGNAVCVTENVVGTSQSTCRQPCGSSTSAPCRQGYVCQATASGDQYCRADCNNGGLLSACPQNQTCTSAGLCQ